MRLKNLTGIAIYLIASLILMGGINNSKAQNGPSLSSAEDIAIAFYKTASVQPPYESWVQSQKPYSETPLARRPKVLEEETQRLAKLYNDYRPSRDLLLIRTNMKLIPSMETIEDDNFYFLKMDIGSDLSNFYLPYAYNDQNFMIVPADFKRFDKFPITEQEFQTITSNTNPKRSIPLLMELLPQEADFSQPYMVDGIAQWMMSTHLVGMQSWSNNGQLIWQYTTTNYTPEKIREIKDLYQEPEKDVQLDQIIQPLE